MGTILIASYGGSPEPILFSIRKNRPEKTYLIVSQQSVQTIARDIKDPLAIDGLAFDCEHLELLTPEDLGACYGPVKELLDRIDQRRSSEMEVVLDFTGGTKPMSSALALAATGRGYTYCYVGGKARSKDGLGAVLTGHERLTQGEDPWALFAVEEKMRLAQNFNEFQFKAA